MRTFLSCFAACLLTVVHAAAQTPHAWESNPDFQKARAEAHKYEAHRQDHGFALKAWQKANKIAGGKCVECLLGSYNLQLGLNEPKQALESASQLGAVVVNTRDQSVAEYLRGRALMQMAGREKPKPALLEEADRCFHKSVELLPTASSSLFLDGRALALLGRSAEAGAAFQKFVEVARKDDPMLIRAKHFAEAPELAARPQAPPIAVTTLTGKQFNLDAMSGRVVLIDFWATWCGPCNQELPHMQKLAQRYANDPFEIVSISWDADETKWKEFIQTHNMVWNQYRDANHSLSEAFGVSSIPHYFTIDSDGVLTAENVGSGSVADGRIEKLVKRAREAAHPDRTSAAMANDPPAEPASTLR